MQMRHFICKYFWSTFVTENKSCKSIFSLPGWSGLSPELKQKWWIRIPGSSGARWRGVDPLLRNRPVNWATTKNTTCVVFVKCSFRQPRTFNHGTLYCRLNSDHSLLMYGSGVLNCEPYITSISYDITACDLRGTLYILIETAVRKTVIQHRQTQDRSQHSTTGILGNVPNNLSQDLYNMLFLILPEQQFSTFLRNTTD